MPQHSAYQRLIEVLHELGVRTADDSGGASANGYPLSVPLADGGSLVLELALPFPISSLDPNHIGVALLDPLGYSRKSWGLATKIPFFKKGKSVLESPVAGLMESSHDGPGAAIYLDGYRYFAGHLGAGDVPDVFVLVVNAHDERMAKKVAGKSARMAQALKRLGKTLTMNQTIQPLCIASAHEIASTAELAAVLIWTIEPESSLLHLTASVGVNRQGQVALRSLSTKGSGSCAAELVGSTRKVFHAESVLDNLMTANLEARCCYLKPGGVSIHPLVISDRLIGVLELIGRANDPHFEDSEELFETVAEHLALALNSATMFENFERWATHDALTGIPNHRSLQEFLHARLVEAERAKAELGVIMLDVDHFRSFNEEEGHDAGDEVLRMVAQSIKSCVRPYDLAARYGGEEFTVVMPGASREAVEAVAERIRQKVESEPFITRGGQERHVTVSLGCALYPSAGMDVASLLKSADTALFKAKREGRNRIFFFEGTLDDAEAKQGIDLPRVVSWIHPDRRASADDLLQKLEPQLDQLGRKLKLSASQCQILRALVLIAESYEDAVSESAANLGKMESAEEFRLLLPALHTFRLRYDGRSGKQKGSKLPLLGRVLAVLLAFAREGEIQLLNDPGRFDPEIVNLALELDPAA